MQPVDVVRALYDAYLAQDREAAERLIASDFVFTSPQDDHIDRDAYFDRCFPTVHHFSAHTLLHVAALDEAHVVSVYEYELADGSGRFRNTELHVVRDGSIHEVQVFFGGRFEPTRRDG